MASNRNKALTLLMALAGFICLSSGSASAQEVRRYGESEESDSQNASDEKESDSSEKEASGNRQLYPGAPKPQSTDSQKGESGTRTRRGSGSPPAGKTESRRPASHRIVFRPDNGSASETDSDAGESVSVNLADIYGGIIPGVRDVLPKARLPRAAEGDSDAKHNLEWVGLKAKKHQPVVFLKLDPVPDYSVERKVNNDKSGKVMEVTLPDTAARHSNIGRHMPVAEFQNGLHSIGTVESRDGRSLRLRIEHSKDVSARVETKDGYLYVTFSRDRDETDSGEPTD